MYPGVFFAVIPFPAYSHKLHPPASNQSLSPSGTDQLPYKLLDSDADLVKGEERAFSACQIFQCQPDAKEA